MNWIEFSVPNVSYAQNQEDVLLALALGDVSRGFYIDIGASHPEIDSVTKHFYDKGWQGVNVEPEPMAYELFLESRSRDHNFNLAIGETNSEVLFFKSSIPGRHSLKEEYAEYLGNTTEKISITQRNLTDLLDQALPQISVIHFLKIDVEGNEKDVLKGINFNKYRPWIILVEALNPMTLIDESQSWESLILESGYLFVHFDGLNKYYLEISQSHRQNFFQRVNVLLADYTPYRLFLSAQQLQELKGDLGNAQHRVGELEANLLTAQHRVGELESIETNFQLITNSKLFKYTHTVRKFYSLVLYTKSRRIGTRSKLSRLSQYLKRYPKIRRVLLSLYLRVMQGKYIALGFTKKAKNQYFRDSHQIFSANRESMQRSFREE